MIWSTVCYCYDSIMHCKWLANINKPKYNCKLFYWNIPIRTVGFATLQNCIRRLPHQKLLKKKSSKNMISLIWQAFSTIELHDNLICLNHPVDFEGVLSHRGDARTRLFTTVYHKGCSLTAIAIVSSTNTIRPFTCHCKDELYT